MRARELHGAAIPARVPACADRACQELHSRARSPPDTVAGVAYEGEHRARAQWGRREEPRFVHPSQSFSSIASSGRIASESSIAPDIRAAANSMTTFSLNKSGRAAE